VPINEIATDQTKSTLKTRVAINQLLYYLATHPGANIRYRKSYVILHVRSDASYLSVSHARSILGGLFYCGNKPSQADKLNGYILNAAVFIKNAVASAAES
jgi:hypothetical protein